MHGLAGRSDSVCSRHGVRVLLGVLLAFRVAAQDYDQGQVFTQGSYRVKVVPGEVGAFSWSGQTGAAPVISWGKLLQFEADLRKSGRGHGMVSKHLVASNGAPDYALPGDWSSDWRSMQSGEGREQDWIYSSARTTNPTAPRVAAVPWGSLDARMVVTQVVQTAGPRHTRTGGYLPTAHTVGYVVQATAPGGVSTAGFSRVNYRAHLKIRTGGK